MEQSLYFDYVKKFFPQVVTSLVEKLNEKNAKTLPYLYKELLTPTFSVDGRWASILAEHTRVAADVVALDSELPLKTRDAVETASGDIPKLGMKLYLTEKQMKDLDAMIAQQLPLNQVVTKLFNDLPRCMEGIWERLEDMFLSELSTGVGLSAGNNGTGVRINVGYKDENKFGAQVVWTDENCTPIDDINNVMDKALDDANTITDIYMDDVALRAFYKSKQVRDQFAFDNGVAVKEGTVGVLDFKKASEVLQSKYGITLHRVARKIKTEINGEKKSHSPWQEGMVVFTCDDKVGSLVWTNTAEATRPVGGVEYQTADNFILLSKYSKNDPLREFTSSQAMVVPIINNVDRIYTLNSKEVQA